MADLYVMVGIPGAGKSTWCKNHVSDCDIYVSRDQIRNSLLKDDDKFFDHETEVFTEFTKKINEGLKKNRDVFADATHLNAASRRKLISKIPLMNYDHLYAIWINTPFDKAIENNEKRIHTKAYVPFYVIRNMASRLTIPTYEEGFEKVFIIEKNKIKCVTYSKEKKYG